MRNPPSPAHWLGAQSATLEDETSGFATCRCPDLRRCRSAGPWIAVSSRAIGKTSEAYALTAATATRHRLTSRVTRPRPASRPPALPAPARPRCALRSEGRPREMRAKAQAGMRQSEVGVSSNAAGRGRPLVQLSVGWTPVASVAQRWARPDSNQRPTDYEAAACGQSAGIAPRSFGRSGRVGASDRGRYGSVKAADRGCCLSIKGLASRERGARIATPIVGAHVRDVEEA